MVPTSLFDAATFHQSVMPVCRCGHSIRFEAVGLWWHFERRGWDDRLAAARRRFWCTACRSRTKHKVRAARLEVIDWTETDICLPSPDERTWKRIMRRVR